MKLKYISWLPAVMIMGIIFYFSSKPAETSGNDSLAVVKYIVNIYENITGTEHQDNEDLMEILDVIVRKGAHFCEYALLATAIAFHLYHIDQKGRQLFLLPIIISALYAASDEYHQTFIPGRSGQFSDVLLDSAGALVGSAFFYMLILFIKKKSQKKRAITESK